MLIGVVKIKTTDASNLILFAFIFIRFICAQTRTNNSTGFSAKTFPFNGHLKGV